MQLTPRYGSDPIIVLDGPPAAIVAPVVRQRRRLVEVLEGFDAVAWAHPSRCDGWSNRDVIVHLDSTNTFWTFSIGAGLRGDPTRFLASFDPVASPVELVAAAGPLDDGEVLARFRASTQALEDLVSSLDDTACEQQAEAPPGHIAVAAVLHHALWDSWIHERDLLEPLGVAQVEEPDEIVAALRYAAALNAGFPLTQGITATGRLAVAATDPDAAFVAEVDGRVLVRSTAGEGTLEADIVLEGEAVDLLEALSRRRPLDREIPDAHAWMVDGLAEVFDQA